MAVLNLRVDSSKRFAFAKNYTAMGDPVDLILGTSAPACRVQESSPELGLKDLLDMTDSLPPHSTAIHHLALIYERFGSHDALDLTKTIAARMSSGLFGQSNGFIAGSDSHGFRSELTDPNPLDHQTNHFFAIAAFALDGVSNFEYAAAIGHELESSFAPIYRNFFDVIRGSFELTAFRDLVEASPLDPEETLDYRAMDKAIERHGWPAKIHEFTHADDSIPMVLAYSAKPLPTGNSVADVRCTVAGLHFGRLVAGGHFQNAGQAARWLERNVLDGSIRTDGGQTRPWAGFGSGLGASPAGDNPRYLSPWGLFNLMSSPFSENP